MNIKLKYELNKIGQTSGICNTGDLQSLHKGYLPKWYKDEYFYKSGEIEYNTFNPNQCIAEELASKLGKAMKFNIIDYELKKLHTRGFEWFNDTIEEQSFVACRCKSFIKKDMNIYTLPEIYGDNLPSYEEFISTYPELEKYINEILIFDYIINNVDRHYNNFEIAECEEGLSLVPIFDNGLSLYADLNDTDIDYINSTTYGYKKFRKAKPFCRNHKSQLNLLRRNNAILPEIKFISDDDIKSIVYNQQLLSDTRKKAIYNLVKRGVKDVRDLYLYVQGY